MLVWFLGSKGWSFDIQGLETHVLQLQEREAGGEGERDGRRERGRERQEGDPCLCLFVLSGPQLIGWCWSTLWAGLPHSVHLCSASLETP